MQVERRKHLLAFVHISHFPQVRKYTGEAYSSHLIKVAELADKYCIHLGYEIGLCHDLFEDTKVTKDELKEFLLRHYSVDETELIINAVIDLTDVYTHEAFPKLNRIERKKLECERMALIDTNSQSVKYCDLIDNTKSITKHDKEFAKVYLKEKFDLLSVMGNGNNDLFNLALKNI